MNTDSPPRCDCYRCEAPVAHFASLLRVLANENRLFLIWLVSEQEISVSDLGILSGIAQKTLSQQLAILRRCGAVTTRREGKRIFYRARSSSQVVALAGTVGDCFTGKSPMARLAAR